MLDSETRRRIDTARDILVGKVPDPKSQVEQITIALIYKFMDDMDHESIEMGGSAGFFKGEYAKYAWTAIFNPRLGGFEMLALYAEAIARLSLNPNLPQLFRDIFKNAYLPYRDPETLKLFLKTINEFKYTHSEDLGDAFEYLLSVMSSQGDAGQFRTPRHIIDFMVAVVRPQKNESVLDPACGTAGFLISAYRYILAANSSPLPLLRPPARAPGEGSGVRGDLLSPADRALLMGNFTGYDISPDMVRLSLVNLYLHGFPQPHILEYDTLTSEEHWNDYADVILANPPFMSPKGGIKPHKRFSVQSNRSEVLFVDYMAEHLTPSGRAAIIVPEGIIFQSAGAYKQLRKVLVEKDFLWAVVSLPAGVFNPYAGVKTSILFLDRALAKKTDKILFLKIEADGYDLGAQRRPVEKNDIPAALRVLADWQKTVHEGNLFAFDPSLQPCSALLVDKTRLAENGEFNLGADRYRYTGPLKIQQWDLVKLGDGRFFNIESGGTPDSKNEDYWNGDVNWATLVDLPQNDHISIITSTQRKISEAGLRNSSAKLIPLNSIIVSTRATIGRVGINLIPLSTNQGFKNIIIIDKSHVDEMFVAFMIKQLKPRMEILASGGTFKEISKTSFSQLEIPLPPLDVQRQIVDEIASYQRIIDGARQVVDNWKPDIAAELQDALPEGIEEWTNKELGKVCEIQDGTHFSPENNETGEYKYVTAKNIKPYYIDLSNLSYVTREAHRQIYEKCPVKKGDVLYIKDGATAGIAAINSLDEEFSLLSSVAVLKPNENELYNKFLVHYLNSKTGRENFLGHIGGVAITRLTLTKLNHIEIPLPPIDIQKEIAYHLETERRIVESNRELIRLYQAKIQRAVARVWEG